MSRLFDTFLKFILFIAGCMLVTPAGATHIVGGEVTYKCLGNNTYEVHVDIYQDCLTGNNQAIIEDNPAFIAIYPGTGVGGTPIKTDSIYQQDPIRVPPNFSNDCVKNPPPTCLRKTSFVKTYKLDPSPTGYKIVYQRCCRNGNIYNVINPSEIGASYYCIIPPGDASTCNNSAVFKNYPPQIICLNTPLVYDHSATDPDGDSLTYEFCQAYEGGSTGNIKPNPPSNIFSPITYRAPFSATKPMAGNPQIQINSRTGMITGTPNIQGRFVVSVCCHEWKNGVIINTVTREFQFVVTDCSKAVVADMPQFSDEPNTYIINCRDYTVKFENTSKGGMTYHWDFGVEGIDTDTSNEFTPTYVYPDSGTYVVRLFVNPGTTCSDSISKFVKVYPTLLPALQSKDYVCPGDTISFQDKSLSSYLISEWIWNYDDNSPFDSTQNTVHRFRYGGLYNVGLRVRNERGCVDTVFKKVQVDPFVAQAGRDTTIVKGEKVNFEGRGGSTYLWSPPIYLDNPNISNPVGTFPVAGNFPYVLQVTTESGCIGFDTVKILVVENPYLVVPNAFSPNEDGTNDTFFPIAAGYTNMKSFRVFNRYGEEIFYTTSFEEPWDGTYKGTRQDIGVYYWMLQVQDRFGNDVMLKGDVTLLR
jgi:gliding motility-associated-like protein